MTNAQTAPIIANPPRSVFTLSATEGTLAFAVAGSVWLYGSRFFLNAPPPTWLLWAFCNALAVSAVCAHRFWGRVPTRNLSALGYAALALPAAQIALLGACAGLRAVSPTEISPLTPLLFGLLFVSFPTHFFTSCAAALRGLCRAQSRGDLIAFPLFFAWIILLSAISEAVGFRL